jgi:uncharacterized membrane protein
MARIIWLIVMLPISVFFTVYGIWFWSGSTVRESEISDIPAYNKANGIMWIVYSLVFWAGSVLGLFEIGIAGIVVAVGCLAGIPVLVLVYRKIYAKYKT